MYLINSNVDWIIRTCFILSLLLPEYIQPTNEAQKNFPGNLNHRVFMGSTVLTNIGALIWEKIDQYCFSNHYV